MATTDEGVVVPALTNLPNVPSDMQALGNSITKKITPSFANSGARVISSPADGQQTYQQDSKREERYWTATSGWSQFLAPTVQMNRTTVQSIPNNALTAVSWVATPTINPAALTCSASGVTVGFAGWYRVRFQGEFVGNVTGRRFANILLNGAEITTLNRQTVASNTANGTGLQLPGMKVLCAAGDVLSIGVFQDSGAALNLSALATFEVELAQ